LNEERCKNLPALALAYMGDAVYDQYVRTVLIQNNPTLGAHALHMAASRIVCAGGQAAALRAIADRFTEEENDIFRRGRNANSPTVPKNADVVEYRVATGFEAVLGYLHLRGDTTRLDQVLELARTLGWKENVYGKDKP
jgi:ribonuclease III family protein